jgi:hypothetical protein
VDSGKLIADSDASELFIEMLKHSARETIHYQLSNGLTAVLYKSPNNKFIFAFSGTNEIGDWRDNFGQALGLNSPQYLLVESVVKEAKEYRVIDTITGHSLGGGMRVQRTIW